MHGGMIPEAMTDVMTVGPMDYAILIMAVLVAIGCIYVAIVSER